VINNYYRLYVEATYKLVETMCLKFGDVALAYNDWLTEQDPTLVIELNDPGTWKYYQNISGRYHATDTPMTVVSLDDLSEIVFSKATLLVHKATRNAYQYDTRYYRDLVNRYPDKELLIMGILHAPDRPDFITEAISAENGTILYHADQYVEVNEYSLLTNLQTWIYNYCDRWIIFPYTITDDLYPATYLGQLYLHLVPALINLRLSACKTAEAHSFHIRQYLASHGMLDAYLDVLSKDQALFFYRNILYIQNHAGQRETFDWLMDNLMTQRGLPLYEYTIKHDTSWMLPTVTDPLQLDYHPQPFFKRKALNVPESNKTSVSYTLDQLLEKMEPNAPSNRVYHAYHRDRIDLQLKTSVSNVMYTKVLESIMDDYSDEAPYTLENTLLYHWVYWATTGVYRAKVTLNILGSKKATSLSARDVLILYVYVVNKALGFNPVSVPEMTALRVQKPVCPSLKNLTDLTDAAYVTPGQLQSILDTFTPITSIVAVDTFYEKAHAIYEQAFVQYGLQSLAPSDHTCAQLQMAAGSLFQNVRCTLSSTPVRYADWLFSLELDLTNYNASEYWALAASLLDQITGYSANKALSIKKIQKSMLEIMGLLSSYSVQFISDVNNSSIRLAASKEIKINEIHTTVLSHEPVETVMFEPLANRTHASSHTQVNLSETGEDFNHSQTHSRGWVDLQVQDVSHVTVAGRYHVPVELCDFTALAGPDPATTYAALTSEQKQTLTSIYH
jgi:hypothetical protein